jgi:hypothetical protein
LSSTSSSLTSLAMNRVNYSFVAELSEEHQERYFECCLFDRFFSGRRARR